MDTIKNQLEIYSTITQGLRDLELRRIQANNQYEADKKKVMADLVTGFDTESDNMYAMEIHESYTKGWCLGFQFYRVTRNMVHIAIIHFEGYQKAPKSNEDVLLILNNLESIDISDFTIMPSSKFYNNMLTPFNGSYRLKWLEESICELRPHHFLVSINKEVYETAVSLIAHLSLSQDYEEIKSHAKQLNTSVKQVVSAAFKKTEGIEPLNLTDSEEEGIMSYWNIDSVEEVLPYVKRAIEHNLNSLKRFPNLNR